MNTDTPYWLLYALAEYVDGCPCEVGGPCRESGDCITEWCAPCAASVWLRDQKARNRITGRSPAEPQERPRRVSENRADEPCIRCGETAEGIYESGSFQDPLCEGCLTGLRVELQGDLDLTDTELAGERGYKGDV